MNQASTVACKLQVTPEQVAKINATLQAFSDACNHINQTVDPKVTKNVRIQSLVYKEIREQFGVSANLAVRALNRVSSDRKIAKSKGKAVKAFHPTSADYDARIFSFREKDWTVSLTFVGGRTRFQLLIGNYQRGLLKGKVPVSATLSGRPDGSHYINISIHAKDEVLEPEEMEKALSENLQLSDISVVSDYRQPF